MKTRMRSTIALTAALVCLTGCGKQGPTPKPDESAKSAVSISIPDDAVSSEPDLVVTEDSAAAVPEDPDAYAQPQLCTVSGSFTATVRKLIPDYVTDPDTPRAAVVTLFQDGPFVIRLTDELCAKLQEDKTFTFLVGEQDVELCQWEFSNGGFVQDIALKEQKIQVTDVREATEEEYGLEGMRIECAPKS